jgi:hypothetical protein
MASEVKPTDALRIGVTGHMNLSDDTVDLVRQDIRKVCREAKAHELIGVICLAAGADTIFAEAIVELGGDLEV